MATEGSGQPILFVIHAGRDRVLADQGSTMLLQAFAGRRTHDLRLFPPTTWAQIEDDSVVCICLIAEHGQLQVLRPRL